MAIWFSIDHSSPFFIIFFLLLTFDFLTWSVVTHVNYIPRVNTCYINKNNNCNCKKIEKVEKIWSTENVWIWLMDKMACSSEYKVRAQSAWKHCVEDFECNGRRSRQFKTWKLNILPNVSNGLCSYCGFFSQTDGCAFMIFLFFFFSFISFIHCHRIESRHQTLNFPLQIQVLAWKWHVGIVSLIENNVEKKHTTNLCLRSKSLLYKYKWDATYDLRPIKKWQSICRLMFIHSHCWCQFSVKCNAIIKLSRYWFELRILQIEDR